MRALLLFALTIPLLAADKTKIEVRVINQFGKPVANAEVIVKFVSGRSKVKLTKIRKSWEVRSSQEGLARIPAIPKGDIQIQVYARNYQTFGQVFDIQEDTRTVEVALKPPQDQYSAHEKD